MSRLPEEDDGWEVIPSPRLEDRERAGFSFDFHLHVGRRRQHHQPASSDLEEGVFNPQSQSLLIAKLPPELRLLIYEHLFTLPPNTTISHKPHHATVLSILQTCKLLHAEAEEIFYEKNRLPPPPLNLLSERRRKAIRKVRVRIKFSGAVLLQILRNLAVETPNLQSLWVEIHQSIRFLDLRGWRVMRGQLKDCLGRFGKLRDLKLELEDVRGSMTEVEKKKLREWEEGVVAVLKEGTRSVI